MPTIVLPDGKQKTGFLEIKRENGLYGLFISFDDGTESRELSTDRIRTIRETVHLARVNGHGGKIYANGGDRVLRVLEF